MGEALTLTGRITDDESNLDKSSFWWDGGVGARWRNAGMAWDNMAADDRGWSGFPPYVVGVTNDRTITATWTPIGVGTYNFHHAGGDNAGAWVDANGVQSVIEVKVKPSPTISMQYLDGAKNVLASNSILVGSNFYIRVNGNSQNAGTNIATYYSRINRPNGTGAAYEEQPGNSTSGYADFGPYYADVAGVWDGWAHVRNADEGGWVDGQSRGWASIGGPDLTVLSPPPPVNGITYNSIGLPATGYVSETITFNASIRNSGTKNFGANHYIVLRAQGSSVDLWAASLNGIGAGQSANVPFTLTLPASAGTYAYTLNALENGVEWFGGTQTGTITVSRRLYSVFVTVVGSGSVTGAGSYYDGDTCTLTPFPAADTYFTGFTGDQVGPGATITNASPAISFSVTRNMSITASFVAKLPQLVTLDNPGTKASNALPFTLRWTTNAGTDPTGSIVSGPATINAAEQVTLDGTQGVVTARLDFPSTVFYMPASIETTFTVGPPMAGTIVDALGASTILSAARPASSLVGNVSSDTLTPFVSSSNEAHSTIALTRLQVAGLYDPNSSAGTSTSSTVTPVGSGSSDNPPAGSLTQNGTKPGQQMTYQGYIYKWDYVGGLSGSGFGWVKVRPAN